MLKTNVDFQHGYQVHITSTFKSNVDLKYVLENVDLLCYYHLTKENANKCSFERGVNMKDVLIKARTLSTGKIVYEYRFEIASVDGKRKWKSKSGFKTKTEAREAGKLAQQAYEHVGQPIEPSNMSYADFLDQWLEMDCKLNCKASTLQGYEKKIRLYIKPALGEYRLKAITKNNLQDFITKMYNDGFSRNTISSVKGLLTKSFDFALDRHYITMTPATRLTIPTKMQPKNKTRTKKHVYIPQNIMNKIFERFPEGSSAYIPLIIGYHTGLRLGEIYALVWEDIDFKNKTLSVNRQVQWETGEERTKEEKKKANGTSESNGFWYFSAPKYNSYRTIEIDDVLVEALKKEYNKQIKARAYYDEYYNKYYCENNMVFSKTDEVLPVNKISQSISQHIVDFVCRREDGSYISPRTAQHTSYIIHTQLNFQEYDIHSLRHTHGTMLSENGADYVYIQRRLGHKDLKTTMEIYTNHLTDTIKEKGVTTLNSLYM